MHPSLRNDHTKYFTGVTVFSHHACHTTISKYAMENDNWAPRKISPYGVMTGVRVPSTVDRLILGLSSSLPEVATGFSGGGLIGSTHATNAWRAGSPSRGRHSFEADEAAHVINEVRHSDFAPRTHDADGAHELGSHAVLLITEYMTVLRNGGHLC